jgi:uncharacterized protein YkwD
MAYTRTPLSRILKASSVFLMAAVLFAVAPSLRAESSDASRSRALVGQARSSHGVAGLADDAGLDKVAAAQAARMAADDRIYHNPNLGSDADAQGVRWTLIGEIVGVGGNVEQVHDAFMVSSGHKANVLHPDYNRLGVGVSVGKDGSVFVAHVFARVESAAPKPAPAAPAAPAAQAAPAVQETAVVKGAVETPSAQATAAPKPEPLFTKPIDPTSPNAVVGGIVTE